MATKLTKNSKPSAVVAAWVKRLTSGKYKQGDGFLRQREDNGTETHCCLGVLCDLAVEAGVIAEPKLATKYEGYEGEIYEYRAKKGNYKHQVQTGILPHLVRDWAGLTDNNGTYETKDGDSRDLTEDNDGNGVSKKKSFKQIAKIIQRKPKGLFVDETV